MSHQHEFKSILGSRQRMLTSGIAPNLALTETQLIRAQVERPRQFMVTVAPPTKGNGVLPYVSTFDGGAYPPVGAAIYTAPPLPDPASAIQVFVRWGAAGVSFETAFDYPALGGVFGITCDTVDVIVKPRGAQPVVFGDANEVPNVGAFMVEGTPADPSPMSWLETTVGLAGLADKFWAVKPFSRSLRVDIGTTGALTERAAVEWLNTTGTILQTDEFLIQAPGSLVVELSVPRQATVVRVVNRTAVAKTVGLEWRIGLS